MFIKNKYTLFQFIKFNIVGIINTFITYLIYTLLVLITNHHYFSLVIEYLAGIPITFLLNKKFTFKDTQKNYFIMLLKMTFCYLIVFCLNMGLLYLFVNMDLLVKIFEKLKIDNFIYSFCNRKIIFFTISVSKVKLLKVIAQFFSLCIVVPISFVFQKYFVFKNNGDKSI